MTEHAQLSSKVLVLEDDPAAQEHIKAFCEDNHLVALKPHGDHVMTVLRSNVDLGAIFIGEDFGGPGAGLPLARTIHEARPELPLLLRRGQAETLHDLSPSDRGMIRGAYTSANMQRLRGVLEKCIFSLVYPQALVRGIMELTVAALESQFVGVQIDVAAPYVVRDRIIFGELFSLIPLESNWCRGYLLLQTQEQALLDFVRAEKTLLPSEFDSFRDVNNLLGELTNLVWGTFKNRYVSDEPLDGHITQVPIIVNHLHRYISFGSEDPQLCFRYVLRDPGRADAAQVVFDQRFVFNLHWMPDKFKENEGAMDALFKAGELELF
ncbi:hypothetical protein BurJ1DRAFT_4000 [Burkholderiales bacterium JOSHI_001]|nr:hypothetical protein BurJ1DRAFT_4000 [Burkholderiales bacterium JOSHI_001]